MQDWAHSRHLGKLCSECTSLKATGVWAGTEVSSLSLMWWLLIILWAYPQSCISTKPSFTTHKNILAGAVSVHIGTCVCIPLSSRADIHLFCPKTSTSSPTSISQACCADTRTQWHWHMCQYRQPVHVCAAHKHTLAFTPDAFEVRTERQKAPCILACVTVKMHHIKKKKFSLSAGDCSLDFNVLKALKYWLSWLCLGLVPEQYINCQDQWEEYTHSLSAFRSSVSKSPDNITIVFESSNLLFLSLRKFIPR